MKKSIKISELSNYDIELSDYNIYTLEKLREELAPFSSVGELLETADINHSNGKYYVEAITILLNYKSNLLKIAKSRHNDKTYQFFLVNPYTHKHAQNYQSNSEKPKKVGKPTLKKMDEWLNYLLNEEEKKKAYAQKHIDQENEFRAELAQLGDKVKWYDECNGHMLINNIVFAFSIEACCINTTVKIKETHNLSISNFLQLADNQYRPAK